MWKIVTESGRVISSNTDQAVIERLWAVYPASIKAVYRKVHESGNVWLDKILTEGLKRNDLEGILLPRLSVDEYVPSETSSDNIVLALFIKGVPEAVLPLKNFCERCNGVLNVDYGDSDTIPNTSIIYVEMDRQGIDMADITEIAEGLAMLGNFKLKDFTLTFPDTNDKFPFNLKTLETYFKSRSRKLNRMAQIKAEKEANAEAEERINRIQKNNSQDEE